MSHYFSPTHTSADRIKKLFVSLRNQNMVLQTAREVFSPENIDKGTEILINALILPSSIENAYFLDLGAGYGPISIWLSKYLAFHELTQQTAQTPPITSLNYKIFASEVNERALWLLKRNIVSNKCGNIEILPGPFQDSVEKLKSSNIKFNAVYTNPPLKTGHKNMLELFEAAADLLTENGFIQYVHKKKLGSEGFQAKLLDIKPTWNIKTIKKQSGYHVILFSPKPLNISSRKSSTSGYF